MHWSFDFWHMNFVGGNSIVGEMKECISRLPSLPIFRAVIIFREAPNICAFWCFSDRVRIANTAHARRAQTKSTTRCKRVVSTTGSIARWTLSDETLIALISFFFFFFFFNISTCFSPVFVNKFPFFLFFFFLISIKYRIQYPPDCWKQSIFRVCYIYFFPFSIFFSSKREKFCRRREMLVSRQSNSTIYFVSVKLLRGIFCIPFSMNVKSIFRFFFFNPKIEGIF